MTIRAILRDGMIQPLDPLPPDWADGQELVVEDPCNSPAQEKAQLDEWAIELDAATAQVSEAEHSLFRQALIDNERESKDAVRREWGLP